MSWPSLVTGEPDTFSSAMIDSSITWLSRCRMISNVTASTGMLIGVPSRTKSGTDHVFQQDNESPELFSRASSEDRKKRGPSLIWNRNSSCRLRGTDYDVAMTVDGRGLRGLDHHGGDGRPDDGRAGHHVTGAQRAEIKARHALEPAGVLDESAAPLADRARGVGGAERLRRERRLRHQAGSPH